MLISPATVPVVKFFADYADASFGINPISPNQVITTNGNFVTQIYYVRFELSETCYTIRPLTINLVHPLQNSPVLRFVILIMIIQKTYSYHSFHLPLSEARMLR
jgi:hypothetical protein